MNPVVLIGYSGHAYVIADILRKNHFAILGYCDNNEKQTNPFELTYLGEESSEENLSILVKNNYFIGIGNNRIRSKVQSLLLSHPKITTSINAIHPSVMVGDFVDLGYGIMLAANVTINPLVTIGNGTICNTRCIIEHECTIGDFAHIAPGAVLAGNVTIGSRSFIGANSVIKQGIIIGKDVIVGAGSVVIRDVPDNVTVVGNPARIIK